MSADNITECPRCKEHQLREWVDVGLVGNKGTLHIEYYCECRECGFSYKYTDNKDTLKAFAEYENSFQKEFYRLLGGNGDPTLPR